MGAGLFMDQRVIADARAVKRRKRCAHPTLWLFTDFWRLPDPLPAIARLPSDISGVVFRHDDDPARATLLAQVIRLCRARRIALVVAGTLAAPAGGGVHRRGGQGGVMPKRHGWVTASAHNGVELRRAARVGADIIFLSPVLNSASHPGQSGLGPLRWRLLARSSRVPVLALGGVRGRTMRQLGSFCGGAGAIDALATGGGRLCR
jgi:thiamine-phosphate pyrophosphorylase